MGTPSFPRTAAGGPSCGARGRAGQDRWRGGPWDSLAVKALAAGATVALLALPTACAGPGDAPPVVIRNVTVIDAVHGRREGRTIVVEGDRITAVASNPRVPRGAQVMDGTGRYLIPGLWDMHVHLTYDEALVADMPRLFLSWGVTSVRDTGGLLERLLPVVRAMRAEGAVAPRVFFSGPLLDGTFVVYDGEGRPEIGIANPSPAVARANVAALKAAGVDFIKIYEMVTPDVFAALLEAAREQGLPVAMHVPLSMLASRAAPGVGSMEHLRNVELDCAAGAEELLAARQAILDDHTEGSGAALRSRLHALQRLPAVADHDPTRCDEVMAALRSTIQVPTLRLNAMALRDPFHRADWPEALERLPGPVAESWRAVTRARLEAPRSGSTAFGEWSLATVARMHQRGIPIGAGTDTPISFALPGHSLHDELDFLVLAGLPPLEALRSATLRPAEFFGLEHEMGRVEPGYRADLVLLDADPLEDIAHTRQIVGVISRGRWFSVDDLRFP